MLFQRICLLLLLCLLAAGRAGAVKNEEQELQACLRPEAPAISDGRSARKDQIAEMRQSVVSFIGDNMAYRKCLERELKLLENMNSPQAQALKAYIDEAILDSLEMDDLVADTFNTQLRIYKSQQK